MAAESSLLAKVDAWLDELFAGWNLLSTVILLLLLVYMVYPLITAKDPDTHPMILARQANVSYVRHPGQSAVYRSNLVPYGSPLKSGLDVKDPAAPVYASRKDGDVRDIWRRVVSGSVDQRGQPTGQFGKIITVRGTEKTEENLSDVSKKINILGGYVRSKGATVVAIYLPNSIELLIAVFAAAFYGFHPVLIPYDKPKDVVLKLFNISRADFLVAAAGSLASQDLHSECKEIKEVMWVVEESSREVDWTDAADGTSTWHEVIDENIKTASSELPANSADDQLKDIVTLWLDESPTSGELVAFTHQNIVAAVSGQLASLPSLYRITPKDVFLAAESFTAPYILVHVFAALFANASIVINSVAGMDVPLGTIAQNVAPTIVAATSTQAFQLHDKTKSLVNSAGKKYALNVQQAALKSGVMPTPSIATKLSAPVTANLGSQPGSLRLLYVFDRTNSDTPPTSSLRLSELRAFTGARIVHALSTAKVAGAIAQTLPTDYRVEDDRKVPAHFGVPLACVELFVKDKGNYKTTEERAQGELWARGPAVANGEANIGVNAEFRDDGCLNYLFEYPAKAQKLSDS